MQAAGASTSAAGCLALVREVCADIKAAGKASDEHWKVLQFLCPDALTGAAEILDNKTVTCCTARASRSTFYLLDSSARTTHCVLPGFCTCQAYCFQVVAKPESVLCKHELAVLLCEALSLYQTAEYDDAEWSDKLNHQMNMGLIGYSSCSGGTPTGPGSGAAPRAAPRV